MRLFNKRNHTEDRSLSRGKVPATLLPASTPVTDVSEANALRVSDAWACVRALADSAASLPVDVYRDTPQGRVEAGPDSRIVQLLGRPSPGSTSADLISRIVVDLNVDGNSFIGKFSGQDGAIVQLGCLPPDQVRVELDGQRIVYAWSSPNGELTLGPSEVLHIKGMSSDGLRGLSPVAQCATALGLSSSLQASAKAFTENGARPSGILTVPPTKDTDVLDELNAQWGARHSGATNLYRTAIVTGEATFTPISFNADDSQFLQQRELSAREVARIFRVPAWMIDAPTGDSLTYANVQQQNRAFVDHSLRPWLVRIEKAVSNDADLCPGSLRVCFNLDGLLRGDADTRSEIYTRALNPDTGWMTRAEVRELEDLTPEENTNA